MGLDRQLIVDGTYFVIEAQGPLPPKDFRDTARLHQVAVAIENREDLAAVRQQ